MAKKLNISFVDLDRAIEQRYHVSIPSFFNKYGEDAFRILERNVLEIVSDRDDVVISTGGGTPCFGDNMDFILSKGCVVYLKMTSAAILSRESRSKKTRPLLASLTDDEKAEKVKSQLKERSRYYERAHFCIEALTPDIDALVELVNKDVSLLSKIVNTSSAVEAE
ncbi:MAG: shikimate kinase [Bacteroidales bacterium]|nr:shikimate kinase [Bacteroidales bacterium]